jgi:hypothetical protein
MTVNEPWTKEYFKRAAEFYDESPTGQYDAEAAAALRCFHTFVKAINDGTDYCNRLIDENVRLKTKLAELQHILEGNK